MEEAIETVGGILSWFPETLGGFSDLACGFMFLGFVICIAVYKFVGRFMS